MKALEAQKEETKKAEMEVAKMRMICQRANEDCNILRQENVKLKQQIQLLRFVKPFFHVFFAGDTVTVYMK